MPLPTAAILIPRAVWALSGNWNPTWPGQPVRLLTVSGRYYAMDRDKRWERVKLAYDAMVLGVGEKASSAVQAIEDAYAKYNRRIHQAYRYHAGRRKTHSHHCRRRRGHLLQFPHRPLPRDHGSTNADGYPRTGMKKLSLDYTTMTQYDHSFQHVHVIFENDDPKNTMGEIIANKGLKQIRIAETEKYPHVSFFFSGGREKPFEGERRIMIPSPKVATYDLKPEMSAIEVTDAIIPEIQHKSADFILSQLCQCRYGGPYRYMGSRHQGRGNR